MLRSDSGGGGVKRATSVPRVTSRQLDALRKDNYPDIKKRSNVSVAPSGSRSLRSAAAEGPVDGGGGPSPAEQAAAAAEAAASAQRARENANTTSLADAQRKLIDSFGKARDTKLGNISAAFQGSDQLLLDNYGKALTGLESSAADNEKSEADATFSNVANAIRERGSVLDQAASLGAGESDMLQTQLTALRNYTANQGEVNRSFFDTLRSVNNGINGLNSDTATSRANLFNQAEGDRESAWANFYNQSADTWTQIENIENSNSNEDYKKKYTDAADKAAAMSGKNYKKKVAGEDETEWAGKGRPRDTALGSSNRAATVNLGGEQKHPEGATLRRGAF